MKRSLEEDSARSQKKQKVESQPRRPSDGQYSKPDHNGEKRQNRDSNYYRAYDKIQHHEHSKSQQSWPASSNSREPATEPKQTASHSEALTQLPPPTSKSANVPAYVPFTVSLGLPPLPSILSSSLATAPFKHKSLLSSYDRNSTSSDISYERLEFLGDAYIEVIASRLIFERFSHLPAGQQSQLRELLVKNETLAEFSRLYGFDGKVEAGSLERMLDDVKEKEKWKGNKGWNKILGDVFEAYVAAVILADAEDGFAAAEKWLTSLWAPKLVEATRDSRGYAYQPNITLVHGEQTDLRTVYNPSAKQELQKRIMGRDAKLEYVKYKDSVELKGDQLGQSRHYIAVYLTGYGYDKKLLGKGEGKNKVEAGNWAATEAMHGECKGIVDECEEVLSKDKEVRKAKRDQEAAATERVS